MPPKSLLPYQQGLLFMMVDRTSPRSLLDLFPEDLKCIEFYIPSTRKNTQAESISRHHLTILGSPLYVLSGPANVCNLSRALPKKSSNGSHSKDPPIRPIPRPESYMKVQRQYVTRHIPFLGGSVFFATEAQSAALRTRHGLIAGALGAIPRRCQPWQGQLKKRARAAAAGFLRGFLRLRAALRRGSRRAAMLCVPCQAR